MGEPRQSVKRALSDYLGSRGGGIIDEQEWDQIQKRFSSSSAGYLRRLLRESGLPLAPLVEGVRQSDFAELERTLLALELEYTTAKSKGEKERAAACRRHVKEAKNHARFALARKSASEAHKAIKKEMVEWMIVWLEDPALFAPWAKLRKRTVEFP